MTDELTDYAVDWLEERSAGEPFLLYLSHKGVHGFRSGTAASRPLRGRPNTHANAHRVDGRAVRKADVGP